MILNWNVTKEDHGLIVAIAQRAKETVAKYGHLYSWHDCVMDLTAVHANGCPLDLRGLLEADAINFAHDVGGIRRHLDRETGRLIDFTPRYRAREAK